MKQPTIEQLNDPNFWDKNAPAEATHTVFNNWLKSDLGFWQFWSKTTKKWHRSPRLDAGILEQMIKRPESAKKFKCDHCDSCGGEKTYRNQAILPIGGKTVCVDWCIHHIVAALNASNLRTIASCCGHGEQDGSIVLEDGRELVIRKYASSVHHPVAPLINERQE